MTEKKQQKILLHEQTFLSLLRSMTVLMLPMVLTAVLAMLRLLSDGHGGGFWDISCLLLSVIGWAGAVWCTKTRLLGVYMPKTGLVLSAMLTGSVVLYALSYAMEQEVISFRAWLWALGRLFGAPVSASVEGIRLLAGGILEGSAVMLTCAVFLTISLTAALPLKRGRKKK